jgi:hypothetical protein
MHNKRLPPALLLLGMVIGCSDQGVEPTDSPLPEFSVVAAAPTLGGTILVGGPGDQLGLAVSVDAGAVYAAGDHRVSGRHGLLAKFDIPPAAPVWTTVETNTNFNALAVSGGVAYTIGGAFPPTCGASDGVGGTESKTMLGRYNDGTGALIGCRSENFFPYRGYEWYYAALAVPPFVYAAGNAEQTGFGHSSPLTIAKYSVAGGPYVAAASEPGIVLGSYTGCCPGESQARALAELSGDLYVAGFSRLPGFGEDNVKRPALMRYTSALARVWKVRPTGNAGGSFNGVTALAGDLYAVGENGPSGNRDFLVEKYNAAGARIWTATSGGAGDDALTGVVAVGSRLFAVGYTTSSGAGGEDGVVLEIDTASGATLSTTHLGGAQNDRANAVATDGSSLFVVGESRSYATAEGNAVGQNDLALWYLPVAIAVEIDIKPGSSPNCFNNNGQGVIPVAILGSADFDVATVDAGTVQLEGLSVGARGKSNKLLAHIEDVSGPVGLPDGFDDLVVQIEDADGGFSEGQSSATLTGNLLPDFGGVPIQGTDEICIVPQQAG